MRDVFTNESSEESRASLPAMSAALFKVKVIGLKKVETHGDYVLAIVSNNENYDVTQDEP